MMRALREYGLPGGEMDEPGVDLTEFLYEYNFPDWFVIHAGTHYSFDWKQIIISLRNTQFFFPSGTSITGGNITGQPYLSQGEAFAFAEQILRRLAALMATTPVGEGVRRSLELEGLRANETTLELVPFESIVSEQEEEDRVVQLIQKSTIVNSGVILKHLRDAHELFVQGKDHPSLGEGRNFIQVLIDTVGAETDAHGGHPAGYPGGTANRLQYLEDVGFFTKDEKTAFGSAWGFLSAGSHPGVPTRDEARIGLILALEFGVLVLLKYANWKSNGYKQFS
jgi:hypothetical protein